MTLSHRNQDELSGEESLSCVVLSGFLGIAPAWLASHKSVSPCCSLFPDLILSPQPISTSTRYKRTSGTTMVRIMTRVFSKNAGILRRYRAHMLILTVSLILINITLFRPIINIWYFIPDSTYSKKGTSSQLQCELGRSLRYNN